MNIQRPQHIPPYAEACLQALSAAQLGAKISSAQLQPAVASPWAQIPLDSFTDLVASKMTALVERGAPRDFIDIYTICQAGLMTTEACWQLWQQRQQLRRFDHNLLQAKFAARSQLMRIEQQRPLPNIQSCPP